MHNKENRKFAVVLLHLILPSIVLLMISSFCKVMRFNLINTELFLIVLPAFVHQIKPKWTLTGLPYNNGGTASIIQHKSHWKSQLSQLSVTFVIAFLYKDYHHGNLHTVAPNEVSNPNEMCQLQSIKLLQAVISLCLWAISKPQILLSHKNMAGAIYSLHLWDTGLDPRRWFLTSPGKVILMAGVLLWKTIRSKNTTFVIWFEPNVCDDKTAAIFLLIIFFIRA